MQARKDITDGAGDKQIDAAVIDDERRRVVIVQGKFYTTTKVDSVPWQEILAAWCQIQNLSALQDSANERLRIKLGEIAHAIDDDYEVDFELLTVGDLTPAARADLESFQFETRRVRLPHRTGQPTPPLIELRNASREITRALDRGETFIVTRNGVPVGELHPLRRSEYVDTGLAQAALATAARVDRIRFRSDVDRGVDQDPTPRG